MTGLVFGEQVILTDINPDAVRNAEYNVKAFALSTRIQVRQGDMFSPIGRGESFDVIIFNPPFGPEKPNTFLEMAMRDHEYRNLTRFFEQVENHLKPRGKIYMVFSDLGDLRYFRGQLRKHEFKVRILARLKEGRFRKYIYELLPKGGSCRFESGNQGWPIEQTHPAFGQWTPKKEQGHLSEQRVFRPSHSAQLKTPRSTSSG